MRCDCSDRRYRYTPRSDRIPSFVFMSADACGQTDGRNCVTHRDDVGFGQSGVDEDESVGKGESRWVGAV